MPSTQQLVRRIKSVKNISKITKAMEMVSASKMRQAQLQALSSRQYARKLDDILSQIAALSQGLEHPLLSSGNQSASPAVLIISTDKGLTGSLNTNLFRAIGHFQEQHQANVYTIGKQARDFTLKSGHHLVAEFGQVKDQISYQSTIPIAKLLIDKFLQGEHSQIFIAYMDFISTLNQKPRITQLLPIEKHQEKSAPISSSEYIFEPDPKSVLDQILPYFIELTIYQSLLEARASEHSARMVAMKNASDNANSLGSELNLVFNRSRQTAITSELSDIVTATMTIGGK